MQCALRHDLKSSAAVHPAVQRIEAHGYAARPGRLREASIVFPHYVTDGPFLFPSGRGGCLMLWSSSGNEGYAMGMARSRSGDVTGRGTRGRASLAKDGATDDLPPLRWPAVRHLHTPNNTPWSAPSSWRSKETILASGCAEPVDANQFQQASLRLRDGHWRERSLALWYPVITFLPNR